MILQDIWQGVGGAGKMAGSALTGAWRATRAGQSLERADQRKRAIQLQEQFDILKGNFNPEVKEQAARKIIEMVQGTKIGQMMQAYQPTGEDLATPEQRTQKYLDPAGYRGLKRKPEFTPVDKVEDLSKIQKAKDAYLTVDKKGKPIYDLPDETRIAFEEAERFVHQRPTDNREYFQGPDIVPEQREEPELYDWRTGERISGAKHSYEPISSYFQVSTDTVPIENIPKTHEQLGLTRKQSEEDFERLREFAEKNIENFNIEQSYLDNTEHYEKLFLAMREGVPDGKGGKRKLTNKEIIEILKSMGR